ncbi:MAG: hypothetical protein E7071_05370 [Bacteroidales bacterium]|nr:hypothetical protein [Bacteroidales bacterium]
MNSNFIDSESKLNYFERLIINNGSSPSLFIEQYLKGSGNELAQKFWSIKSSSRLCFDLYSWLCNEKGVSNFEFEKQLPKINIGKKQSSPPNIDVYFEYHDKIVFIESKYTEQDKWKYKNDKNLSRAYWDTNPEGYKSCKYTIEKRFYDNKFIADKFSYFCEQVQECIDIHKKEEKDKYSWFDPKQETCHLFGIIFYVINNGIKDKDIYLCNNVWECQNDSFIIENSIVAEFKRLAENMLNELFKENNCKFKFEVNKIQDILSNGFMGFNFTEAKLFAKEEKVKDFIEENYQYRKR